MSAVSGCSHCTMPELCSCHRDHGFTKPKALTLWHLEKWYGQGWEGRMERRVLLEWDGIEGIRAGALLPPISTGGQGTRRTPRVGVAGELAAEGE